MWHSEQVSKCGKMSMKRYVGTVPIGDHIHKLAVLGTQGRERVLPSEALP